MFRALLLLACACTLAGAAPGKLAVRAEAALAFAVDPAFQAAGGLQYFYHLAPPAATLRPTCAVFARLRPLDRANRWDGLAVPLPATQSRLVYSIDKDTTFFTAARATDPDFINTIVPALRVERQADGSFSVGRAPAHRLRVEFLDRAGVAAARTQPWLASALALSDRCDLPESVVIQENTDFSRIFGFRTAELSITVTMHHALAPGRTQVTTLNLAYLHSLPPWFLGGERRLYQESVRGAVDLITRMRAYPAEPVAAAPRRSE